jgi:hypothetical protein
MSHKTKCERIEETGTRDLHHQYQQEAETAPRLKNDEYDKRIENEHYGHTKTDRGMDQQVRGSSM